MPPDRSLVLDQVLGSLDKAIAAWTRPQFGLLDPLTGKPTPPDHYGQTCAALAMCSLTPAPAREREDALQAWLNTPDDDIGHLPFNRLALGLMRSLHGENLGPATQALVEEGIGRCRLRTRYRSNNWTLLAATCRLIDAPIEDRPRHAGALAAMLQSWTTAKGAFIDFPAKPGDAICTPIAYHHKALFLAALALRFCSHDGLAGQTLRLFEWLVHCWDDAGYAGGFGRTNHALFGDACLIAALILLDLDEGGPVDRIANRLLKQMRPDGFLWLDPWGPRHGTRHWDDYMHLSVYNAWAAAIIQSARLVSERKPVSPHLKGLLWQANQSGLHHDEEAGLASWRDEQGNVALFSTLGQPPQAQVQGSVDLRYAGGRIYHLRLAAGPPVLQPGYREPLSRLANDPTLAGPTPIMETDKALCAIDTYSVLDLKPTSDGFFLELAGNARFLQRPAPSSFFGRVVAAIDWRFLNGRLRRRATLKRTAIPELSARLTIRVTENSSSLTLTRHLYIPSDAARRCVNPPKDRFNERTSSTLYPERIAGNDDDTRGTTPLLCLFTSEQIYDLTTGALLGGLPDAGTREAPKIAPFLALDQVPAGTGELRASHIPPPHLS